MLNYGDTIAVSNYKTKETELLNLGIFSILPSSANLDLFPLLIELILLTLLLPWRIGRLIWSRIVCQEPIPVQLSMVSQY